MLPLGLLGSALGSLLGPLPPQTTPAPALKADAGPVVAICRAAEGETVQPMRPFGRGLAVVRAADGIPSMFALVRRLVEQRGSLELWRSADGGTTWALCLETTTADDGEGALVVGADGLLHVAWAARDEGSWSSAFYQTIDPAALRWIGQPTVLLRGRGDQDQFAVSDIESMISGSVVVAATCHRRPTDPAWTSGWSTGLLVLPTDGTWRGPVQANTSRYGVWSDLQAHGDHVHLSYRTTPGDSVIATRSFVPADMAFVQPQDERVGPPGDAESPRGHVTNACQTLVDVDGRRYVLYCVGAQQPGSGRLLLAASEPNGPWQTLEIAADPPLQAGNLHPTNFTLARGPGSQVLVLHAPAAEDFAVLYQHVVDAGQVVGPRRIAARGAPGQFFTLNGTRFRDGNSTLRACIGQRDGKVVWALGGPWPTRTTWVRSR